MSAAATTTTMFYGTTTTTTNAYDCYNNSANLTPIASDGDEVCSCSSCDTSCSPSSPAAESALIEEETTPATSIAGALPLKQHQHQHQHHQPLAANAKGAATLQQQQQQQQREIIVETLIPSLDSILTHIVTTNDALFPYDERNATVFDLKCRPDISIRDYLERIVTYARCSPECYITALCYLDALTSKDHTFHCTSRNIHRLLITSVMIAAKFLDDVHYNNAFYALIGGMPTKKLNTLELEFLRRLNFDLIVPPAVFHAYKDSLMDWPLRVQQQQHHEFPIHHQRHHQPSSYYHHGQQQQQQQAYY